VDAKFKKWILENQMPTTEYLPDYDITLKIDVENLPKTLSNKQIVF